MRLAKALSEPAVDRGEKITGLLPLALIAQQGSSRRRRLPCRPNPGAGFDVATFSSDHVLHWYRR